MDIELAKKIATKLSKDCKQSYCVVKLNSCSCIEIYEEDKATKEKNIEIIWCYGKDKCK